MIYFKKLRYKNLLSTGNTFTEINLRNTRTTLIIGKNGCGKSTMIDAICFCLYGKPFRNINKPLLLNSITNKDLLTEIEFQIGSCEYKVVRGIKPNIFEIYIDGKVSNKLSKTLDQQEFLEKSILKLNYKSFRQIVVVGSASFVPFMQLTAKDRREVIEDLLDLSIFSTMNTLLKDKIVKNKDDIKDNETIISNIKEKIELNNKHKNALKENNKEIIKVKNDKIKEYEEKINDIEVNIKTSSLELEKISKEIDILSKYKTKETEVSALLNNLSLKRDKLKNEVNFYKHNDNCPTCKQNILHDFKIEIVDQKTLKIDEISLAIKKLSTEFEKLSEHIDVLFDKNLEYDRLNKNITNWSISLTSTYSFIKDLRKEIDSINSRNEEIQFDDKETIKLQTQEKEEINKRKLLLEQKEIYNASLPMLKDGGFKSIFIKQYIPIINNLVNTYLQSLDFFVNFELNENFEETIKSRFRDEFRYDSFSQGEKARIDLALLFTWRSIAKIRNSAATNLLIFDEVFDGSLDLSGTDDLMKILSTLTDDTNIFVISHKDNMVDKFDRVLQFVKVKNFSKMETI